MIKNTTEWEIQEKKKKKKEEIKSIFVILHWDTNSRPRRTKEESSGNID